VAAACGLDFHERWCAFPTTNGSERRDEALAPGRGVVSDRRTNEWSTTKRIRKDKEEEKKKKKKKREMEKQI
jgi:hypothetical protein